MADETVFVVLIVADDCHLCERARQVLTAVFGDASLLIRELNWQSEEGGSLVRRDGVPFPPALYVRDSLVGYGRISERALRRQLSKTGP